MSLQRFGVMGRPIAHSLSPLIHAEFAKLMGIALTYEAILPEQDNLSAAVADFFQSGGRGLNITQPFKEGAYRLCQHLSPAAAEAAAVNTLWMEGATLCGDNTDGAGFVRDILQYTLLAGRRVLIIGAGGAARGILGPLLLQMPAQVALVNRSLPRAQGLAALFPMLQIFPMNAIRGIFDIVINASSAAVNNQALLLPETLIKPAMFCYDLSYQPEGDTAFVAYAKSKGAEAIDGLGMLVEQAALSFELWHGCLPDTVAVKALLAKKATNLIG